MATVRTAALTVLMSPSQAATAAGRCNRNSRKGQWSVRGRVRPGRPALLRTSQAAQQERKGGGQGTRAGQHPAEGCEGPHRPTLLRPSQAVLAERGDETEKGKDSRG
jgi:hypothetical protein